MDEIKDTDKKNPHDASHQADDVTLANAFLDSLSDPSSTATCSSGAVSWSFTASALDRSAYEYVRKVDLLEFKEQWDQMAHKATIGVAERVCLHEAKAKEDAQVALRFLKTVSSADADSVKPNKQDSDSKKVHEELEMLECFIIEVTEHISEIEHIALSLAEEHVDVLSIQKLFRTFHTIKGGAQSTGKNAVAQVAHALEDVFEEMENKVCQMEVGLVTSLLLKSVDVLRILVQKSNDDQEPPSKEMESLEHEIEDVKSSLVQLPIANMSSPSTESSKDDPQEHRGGCLRKEKMDLQDISYVRVTTGCLEKIMNEIGELALKRGRIDSCVEAFCGLEEEVGALKKEVMNHLSVWQDALNDEEALEGDLKFGEKAEKSEAKEPPSPSFQESQLALLYQISEEVVQWGSRMSDYCSVIVEESDLLGKITASLQDAIIHIRMIPLRPLFQRLHRAALETAKEVDKSIKFSVTAQTALIDKAVADQLYTPLLHLVRNAVVHGLEHKEERLKVNKKPVGELRAHAYHQANQVVIEIGDDGAGINLEALQEEAEKQNKLIENEVLDLMFSPGLSTAADVSVCSGRGVGMDVFYHEITKLNGRIQVQTQQGKGTTFIIRLPLMLAINEAIIVKSGSACFALLAGCVDRVVKSENPLISYSDEDEEVVHLQGDVVPLIRLSELCEMKESSSQREGAYVLYTAGEHQGAIHVSEVIGKQEIVIKPLGGLLQHHPFIGGGSLLGDGSMVLILDLMKLRNDKGSFSSE